MEVDGEDNLEISSLSKIKSEESSSSLLTVSDPLQEVDQEVNVESRSRKIADDIISIMINEEQFEDQEILVNLSPTDSAFDSQYIKEVNVEYIKNAFQTSDENFSIQSEISALETDDIIPKIKDETTEDTDTESHSQEKYTLNAPEYPKLETNCFLCYFMYSCILVLTKFIITNYIY